ncbi:MAG: RNA polymerase sigma factor [Phycisphaerae bacterium]|nr:RNA polymerase sigma factor [Phycisphaerae bacterium]
MEKHGARSSSPATADFDPEIPVVEAIRHGDAYALAELMRRQGRWVRGVIFAVCGRMADVDDVTQQVWLRVWQEAPRLAEPSRWRAWLYRIARNAAVDSLRSRRRQRTLVEAVTSAGQLRRHDEPPETVLAGQEEQTLVLDAIAELPALYREPFVLRHLENWSYAEIGGLLGLPADTVETRLVRARRKLREALKGKT